ncbi:outer membrane beta-barrel protein [Spirosoma rigui]|uniref:outer membrane beta-barrel protein n=1 Tax=Spirosoma rigui TaxID=564064 RepID=UPI0009B155E6|nr:outer membrane beta-barrel protein [Spirosoma rigui]
MRHFVLLLALVLPRLSVAQSAPDAGNPNFLAKGQVVVGLSVGSGYKGNKPETRSLIPRLHYFLADGWSVAVEGRYLKATSLYDFTYLGAGLSTRYYVVRGKHLAVFAQLGALYGQSTYHRFDPTDYLATMNGVRNSNWQTSAGLGVQYRAGKRWSIEAQAERNWLPASYLTPAYNRWQAGIGLNYHLR